MDQASDQKAGEGWEFTTKGCIVGEAVQKSKTTAPKLLWPIGQHSKVSREKWIPWIVHDALMSVSCHCVCLHSKGLCRLVGVSKVCRWGDHPGFTGDPRVTQSPYRREAEGWETTVGVQWPQSSRRSLEPRSKGDPLWGANTNRFTLRPSGQKQLHQHSEFCFVSSCVCSNKRVLFYTVMF